MSYSWRLTILMRCGGGRGGELENCGAARINPQHGARPTLAHLDVARVRDVEAVRNRQSLLDQRLLVDEVLRERGQGAGAWRHTKDSETASCMVKRRLQQYRHLVLREVQQLGEEEPLRAHTEARIVITSACVRASPRLRQCSGTPNAAQQRTSVALRAIPSAVMPDVRNIMGPILARILRALSANASATCSSVSSNTSRRCTISPTASSSNCRSCSMYLHQAAPRGEHSHKVMHTRVISPAPYYATAARIARHLHNTST